MEDIISEQELLGCIDTKCFGRNVIYFEETDSTNIQGKRLAKEGAAHGTLILAGTQNAGRGRRGRGWVSEPGSGIWMSLLLRPDLEPASASALTLAAAAAVTGALVKQTKLPVKIKWPNDIVLNGKKICGILTEMNTSVEKIDYLVIGIGINVNTEEFPREIADVAASLYTESGKKYKRSRIIASVMSELESYYDKYLQAKGIKLFMEEYNTYLVNRGRKVAVLGGDIGNQKTLFTGTALGINEEGALLVQTEDGKIQEVLSGEVSVRGVYSYV